MSGLLLAEKKCKFLSFDPKMISNISTETGPPHKEANGEGLITCGIESVNLIKADNHVGFYELFFL
jgi:hypothetical protein